MWCGVSHVINNISTLDNVLCRQPYGDRGLRGTEGVEHVHGGPAAVRPAIQAKCNVGDKQ
jgi:hypothetical protein